MIKYKTKPIDYTNCHPVIAEHLKRGESILCRVWDQVDTEDSLDVYVCGFKHLSMYPYCTDCEGYIHAEPIEIKRVVLDQVRLMQVLTEEGYVPTEENCFKSLKHEILFLYKMWQYCGKEIADGLYVNCYTFKESWTEEVEI